MQQLIDTTKKVICDSEHLPFSVYRSFKEQHMLNVPVIKPLFIAVLSGNKELGAEGELLCPAANFVFLSNTPTISMRNILSDSEYYALLIEFDYADFDCLEHRTSRGNTYFKGKLSHDSNSPYSSLLNGQHCLLLSSGISGAKRFSKLLPH